MTETQKPFACSIKGCDMTFTNDDHLNWHQKKHDMMLNLGLTSKNNEVADQTPTPTRFIRNCEEVGLFQDLQNVNPFDEFFKKAVEAAKSGSTLDVPQSQINSDDTLHTPHILPHIEETQKKINSSTNENSHSNDFLSNVIALGNSNNDTSEIIETPIFIVDEEDKGLETREVPNIKLKIKEALRTKDKQKNKPVAVSLVPVHNLLDQKQVILNSETVSVINKARKENKEKWKNVSSPTLSIDKIREMNRVAQVRCRKRKKEALKNMEGELIKLREEVRTLKRENYWLKAQLLGHTDDVTNDDNEEGTTESNFVPRILKKSAAKKGKKNGIKPRNIPTTPVPIPVTINNVPPITPKITIPTNGVTTSPVIQFVQVVPAISFPVSATTKIETKKMLRPIVPKIVIDQ